MDFTPKKITVEREFDRNDWAGFHDAVLDATDKSPNQQELIKIWKKLPIDIKLTAMEWGMGDTVFGDQVYTWIIENEKTK